MSQVSTGVGLERDPAGDRPRAACMRCSTGGRKRAVSPPSTANVLRPSGTWDMLRKRSAARTWFIAFRATPA